MINSKDHIIIFISALCILSLSIFAEVNDDIKDYIVYLGRTSNEYNVVSQHISILQQIVRGRNAEETIIRSYKRSFNGFAAKLTQNEYQILKSMKEVVSVFPSRTLHLQTTRSWDFLGLPEPTPEQQTAESNVIIGVIDTGVWPESPSFNDDGLSPIPTKWLGNCQGGKSFTCNKKVIGARVYVGETARDDDGHGSHTASIAAGRIVKNTSFYGLANGSARGGVPTARIAVYKVCDSSGCKGSEILAAFDDAIADGVDFISISMGNDLQSKFDEDPIAIGGFHATEKGILTVQSAGNNGDSGTVGSVAPWLFSVAASTTDRLIVDKVVLGNGNTMIGTTVNTITMTGQHPLIHGKDASSRDCDESSAKLCDYTCLDENLVKGKIVVCDGSNDRDDVSPYVEAFRAHALGALSMCLNPNVSKAFPLPAASLNSTDFAALKSYLNSTKDPKASILKSETTDDTSAPIVAQFSSRGPNSIATDILKPDISAPGVDILAAYSPLGHVISADFPGDKRSVTYNVLSGTSMACPHVAAATAYVKSLHPDWSPSAMKSSLMTTANPMRNSDNQDDEFAYGSGHINPTKATNPGLLYEITDDDYITLLCRLGYDKEKIGIITGNNNVTCPEKPNQSPNDVNYPSMSALVDAGKPFSVKFKRSVTNVGFPNSIYTAKVASVSKIRVTVEPSSLSFKSLKEIKSFDVSVVGEGIVNKSVVSASLVWTDGVHSVRSPIAVYTSFGS